ncbi:MAG: glutamate--tRNA ligase [Hyphomicrobiales bacterium]|nr:glutamate--tRNA ligase [Hyphomicrobiales bacterium]
MSTIVRFAPSPTGRLHIGNVRTALLNWLFARKTGGKFILRLDDTDRTRSTEAFADAIKSDLTWLGLTWDETFRQSDRLARYAEVAHRLEAEQRLYRCYETEDELDRRRKRQLARGLPPVYDRAGLRLTAQERAKLEAEGRRPHWRFRLDTDGEGRHARWDDLVRGPQPIDLSSLSDPVLVRADGAPLYTFTSVVDDVDTGITHVIRGEDHVTNTAVQIQIFKALGATVPSFAHYSLLVGASGEALSKRLDSLSVAGLREAGIEAMAILSQAALIGTSDPVVPHVSLATLSAGFDLAKLSRSPSRFDPDELEALNAKVLHLLTYSAVAPRLAELGADGGEPFWRAVSGNLERLAEARHWYNVVHGAVETVIEDAAFCRTAAGLLPTEPWDEGTWKLWTDAVKMATGAKGRALFHPLRLALTGAETGPELKVLLPLIGRTRALARLGGPAG